MKRMLIALLPLSLFACAEPTAEDAGATADDITAIDDLAPLEANLGLTKDEDRTRPEAVVKAGPCYQKMEASGRTWNMRRYTKGAAFFYTRADGSALDPIACVDLDVDSGEPSTVALNELSLDIVQRFRLGGLSTSVGVGDPTDGVHMFGFAKGAIELGRISSHSPLELADDMPGYDGSFRATIRAVTADAFPQNHTPLGPGQWVPAVSTLVPSIAMLAYRYAKQDPGQAMADDPVGRFVSLEDRSVGDFDAWNYVAHFEKVDVEYKYFRGGDGGEGGGLSGPAHEEVVLKDRANQPHAGCIRLKNGEGGCYVEPSKGKWEIPWGADFN